MLSWKISLEDVYKRQASKLPEYPVVMAMKGVGKSLGPQLMAEIGDVSLSLIHI